VSYTPGYVKVDDAKDAVQDKVDGDNSS